MLTESAAERPTTSAVLVPAVAGRRAPTRPRPGPEATPLATWGPEGPGAAKKLSVRMLPLPAVVPRPAFGVIKKSGDDRAGSLAALIAFYGFLALFPLLLLLTTALGLSISGPLAEVSCSTRPSMADR